MLCLAFATHLRCMPLLPLRAVPFGLVYVRARVTTLFVRLRCYYLVHTALRIAGFAARLPRLLYRSRRVTFVVRALLFGSCRCCRCCGLRCYLRCVAFATTRLSALFAFRGSLIRFLPFCVYLPTATGSFPSCYCITTTRTLLF